MKVYKLFFFIIILFSTDFIAQGKTDYKILSAENGRFVFGQVSEFRRDQFLLDTHTGRMWQIVETEDKRQLLQPVLFSSLDGTRTIIPEDPEIQWRKLQEKWNKNNSENPNKENNDEK